MPLKEGKSQGTISHNIEVEKKAHPDMSNAQAAAIAYHKAGESKDKINEFPNNTPQRSNPQYAINDETAEAWISKKIAQLIKEGYEPKEAEAIAYAEHRRNAKKSGDDDTGKTFKIYSSDSMSVREYDLNGWPEIKGNPISKVGVFPYLGKQISPDLDPERIYNVYRPQEELENEETIESFKLLPFTDEHEMLGSADEGMTPAEKKGIHGVIGEDVYFADGYLKGNIKIFSDKLNKLIKDGKKELSIGYRCLYDIQSGVYDGVRYDAIQRNIRGNHLALVDEGRSGHDVAVLDHFKFTFDTKELTNMPSAERPGYMTDEDYEKMPHAELVKHVKDLSAQLEKNMSEKKMQDEEPNESEAKKELSEKAAHEGDAKDEEGEYKKFVNKQEMDTSEEEEMSQDEEPIENEGKKGDMSKPKDKGMDAQVKALRKEVDTLKKSGFKEMVQHISKRNALAEKLSNLVGTFDHADMTVNEVAAYGIKKLGLKCNSGHELSVLDGYFAAVGSNSVPATAQDSKLQSGCVDAYLSKGGE